MARLKCKIALENICGVVMALAIVPVCYAHFAHSTEQCVAAQWSAIVGGKS